MRIIQEIGELRFIIDASLCWILHNLNYHKVTTLNSPSNTLIAFCNWNVFSIFTLGSHLDSFFLQHLVPLLLSFACFNSNNKMITKTILLGFFLFF